MPTARVRRANSARIPSSTYTGRNLRVSDAFSDSIRTLAITARRNSSPLSRKSTKKMKKSRLVGKNGICNVYNTNVPKKDRQYLSWTTFASIYYTIALIHGDLSPDFRYLNRTQCVVNLDSVYSSFLFAVETHHTIGYGHRYITTECPLAGATVCLQAVCGLLIQSFMVGLVFAKLARPKKRAETIIFSEKAVICLRDGQLCFLCRVGDMRNTHLVEAHVRLQFISDRETAEGEIEPLHQFEMKVGPTITDDDRLFLVWPTTLCHVINKDSPLYEYTASSLLSAQFEIICLLEGIVESTGMTAQAKTSYLPCEILWGHRTHKALLVDRHQPIPPANTGGQYPVTRQHKPRPKAGLTNCKDQKQEIDRGHEKRQERGITGKMDFVREIPYFEIRTSKQRYMKRIALLGSLVDYSSDDRCPMSFYVFVAKSSGTALFGQSAHVYRFSLRELSNRTYCSAGLTGASQF
ncbi:inward rectifier potassium channel [Teladorsagia circumcincta]|uniref:Inward rectifier potassium channel n=1 Tax=Teladorsagia circumcincta TaxID=45464 RepID=A0A2G9V0C3_TELCI|nr:inward rectifier potassium channel [Teladorsagia circumcincta]